MNSTVRAVLIGLALISLGVVGWVACRTPPPPPPAAVTLRLVDGALGRFDGGGQKYVPLPLGTEVTAEQPLMSGDAGAVLHLSSGGSIVLAPQTATTLLADLPGQAGGALRMRLDDGRLWLHLKGEEEVQVSSFRSMVEARRGDCEVRVFKGRDHFINTVALMWKGQGTLHGGDKLRVERSLSEGSRAQVDDSTVYPATRFDAKTHDAWQARMLALP